jgi:hypothetical protein
MALRATLDSDLPRQDLGTYQEDGGEVGVLDSDGLRRRYPSHPRTLVPECDSMSPRKDLVEHSAPFLPEGSEIRQVFICQAAPNFAYFVVTYLTGLTMHRIKYRCVAVTKDAIYVLESSKLSGGARPQSLVDTMPRHTQLGPVSGRWAEITLLGERHWVHKRFHPSIADADREAGFTGQQAS